MRSVDRERSTDRFITWRRCRLLNAGFDPRLATRLAADGATDLHALLDLVDRGCPPSLAARILAPLNTQAAEERARR